MELEKIGKPSEFWYYFGEISKIPRCSGNEDKVRDYIKTEAEKMGFETRVDNARNLLVRISPNSDKKAIVTQSHLDMVCEQNTGVNHDFSTDPLKLKLIKIDEKEFLTAEGTTLGADNGVGIAFQLALMKSIFQGKEDFKDHPIDLLFTVDEESGMSGAFQLDKSMINGDYLINLDGFEDSCVIIGNVGGSPTMISIKPNLLDLKDKVSELQAIKIEISGLVGGHSALDIDKGRFNAIKLMGRLLHELSEKLTFHLISIEGGDKMNAIPRECSSLLCINKVNYSAVERLIEKLEKKYKVESTGIDERINIEINKISDEITKVISQEDQEKIINFICEVINGPIFYHPDFDNLVHTSTNFSSISTKSRNIKLNFMQRSFDIKENEKISMEIKNLLTNLNLKFKHTFIEGYGAWIPDRSSRLFQIAKKTYKALFNEEINTLAIHATLENGIFRGHYPNLQMITYGPNGYDAHSPDERLEVKSVEKSCKFLIQLLKDLIKT